MQNGSMEQWQVREKPCKGWFMAIADSEATIRVNSYDSLQVRFTGLFTFYLFQVNRTDPV